MKTVHALLLASALSISACAPSVVSNEQPLSEAPPISAQAAVAPQESVGLEILTLIIAIFLAAKGFLWIPAG